MKGTIPAFAYEGKQTGNHLLALGAVHGDEPCGTIALAQLRMELDAGVLRLEAGRLTIAPICNPTAYAQRKRFLEVNLNRSIMSHDQPACDEHRYANQLITLIQKADFVLDIHSYSAGTKPFLFLDYTTPAHRALAEAQGIAHWVTGWPELYARVPELSSGDSIGYAHALGKPGVLIECGRHDDPAATTLAYRCLRRTLAHLSIMQDTNLSSPVAPKLYRVLEVVKRDREGSFTEDWQHLDPVLTDQPLIQYSDGTTYNAPLTGVVILPNAKAEPNHEWLYIGRETIRDS